MNNYAKTRYANLYRYEPTGVYFVRAKVRGRLVRDSLETKSIEVAKRKLDARLEKERSRRLLKADVELTVEDLSARYLAALESNHDMKSGAKKYRRETIGFIRRTWPEVFTLTPYKVEYDAVAAWASKLRTMKTPTGGTGYSATRYNGALQTLRGVLQVAVDLGLILDNPVRMANKKRGIKGIAWAKVPLKDWRLPTVSKFNELLARLRELSSRERASKVVRFLSFSGLRIGAARRVLPEHVNLEEGWLSKPPIKYTDTVKRIPLNDDLRSVLVELVNDYPGEGPLLPIKDPRRALRTACEECGIEPLNNHALRHLFVTRCLEATPPIDIRTIADWLDHSDNGALLLKRYAHLLDEHSRRMAGRLKFTGGDGVALKIA